MRQKSIWTKLFLFGAISSLYSCGKPTDQFARSLEDDIYVNKSGVSVTLEGYGHYMGAGDEFNAVWSASVNSSIAFNFNFGAGGSSHAVAPRFCDSIRLIFDSKKELWYRKDDKQQGNIIDRANAKKSMQTEGHTQYLFEITELQYDLAKEI